MPQTAIFGPFFATIFLTLLVWVYTYIRRIAFIRGNDIRPKDMAVPGRLAQISPPEVSNPSDNLGFRVLHSAVHCTFNLVMLRFYLYLFSTLAVDHELFWGNGRCPSSSGGSWVAWDRGRDVRGFTDWRKESKPMSRRPHLAFVSILAVCVGCDHAAKQAAVSLLAGSPGFDLAGGALRFELASNTGAFLSLGANLPEALRSFFLMGLVPLLIAFICLYSLRAARTSRAGLAALAILAGGGFGNWLDRVLHDGAVTDFVSIGIGRFRTGIFNLADLAVVAGVFLLLHSMKQRQAPAPKQTA